MRDGNRAIHRWRTGIRERERERGFVAAGPAIALVVASIALACNVEPQLYLAGIPGVGTSFEVSSVSDRHGYLDVVLEGPAGSLRSFAPADAECRQVLAPEATVEFTAAGAVGAFRNSAGAVCRAVGIGSLEDWRDRRPRPEQLRSSPVPREAAFYDLLYRDEEVAFLRGSFPLGGTVGWSGLDDSIAVVPNGPACQDVLERESASMEYRPAGTPVLSLTYDTGPCRIVGLIQPLRR
jgi:hypothetical protein